MHNRTYNNIENYEWDIKKARSNKKKYGIDFADAIYVLEDDHVITIGRDALGRILVVVSTFRGNCIRIISARKATANERVQYE